MIATKKALAPIPDSTLTLKDVIDEKHIDRYDLMTAMIVTLELSRKSEERGEEDCTAVMESAYQVIFRMLCGGRLRR